MGNNEQEVINILPLILLKDLKREIWGPVLRRHPYFGMIRDQFVGTEIGICHRAVVETIGYMDDTIFAMGDYGDRALSVLKGTLRYPLTDETVHAGRWLCEACLWTRWQHRGDLFSSETTSIVGVLSKELSEVVAEHLSVLVAT